MDEEYYIDAINYAVDIDQCCIFNAYGDDELSFELFERILNNTKGDCLLENQGHIIFERRNEVISVIDSYDEYPDCSFKNCDELLKTEHVIGFHNEQYDFLIHTAYEMNPLPVTDETGKRGRKKKGKIRALIERLDNYKGAVCLFFNDFKVAFDNNQAERDLRMIKVKTKVSGCFRSEEGIRDYLSAMSYIGTAKKHGKNAFQAILIVFEGNIFYAIED